MTGPNFDPTDGKRIDQPSDPWERSYAHDGDRAGLVPPDEISGSFTYRDGVLTLSRALPPDMRTHVDLREPVRARVYEVGHTRSGRPFTDRDGECVCDYNPETTQGPEEHCPFHGRPYAYWVDGCADLNEKLRAAEQRARDILAAIDALIGPDEVFPDWSAYPHMKRVTERRRDLGAEVTTTMVEERALRNALKDLR